MSGSDSYRVAEHLEQEALEDRLLVYDPNGGQVVELNSTAALVVQLCDGERSVSEIQKALAEAFPEAAAQIAVEVPELVEQLVGDGVLQPS